MDTERNYYQAAYFQASEELKRIYQDLEELSMRREKMAEVIEALQPRVGFTTEDESYSLSLTTRKKGATIVTRLSITDYSNLE